MNTAELLGKLANRGPEASNMFGGIPVSEVLKKAAKGKPSDLVFYRANGKDLTIEAGELYPEYNVVVFAGVHNGDQTISNETLTNALKNNVPPDYEIVYVDFDNTEGFYNTTDVQTESGKVLLTGEFLR